MIIEASDIGPDGPDGPDGSDGSNSTDDIYWLWCGITVTLLFYLMGMLLSAISALIMGTLVGLTSMLLIVKMYNDKENSQW
ncbi:MAG: hypothetical protein Q8O87_04210 [bacterium]|nr:hypothetical protein [bacterium]